MQPSAPDIERLMRRHLVRVEPYSPVDPSEELARQAGVRPEDVVRLNANENPFGPLPEVVEALASIQAHLYPDPLQRPVREALSNYTGMPPECLLAGAGSDELIDLLMRLFLEPAERVLDCDPTFGMYAFLARVANARVVSVPRDERFAVDVEAVAREVDEHSKILFVASPNNPTGNSLGEAQALELLRLGIMLVLDETYYEFSGKTLAHLAPEHPNLVVLRSLSKWAGLAGLRIGYMIANPLVIEHLIDIKQPYNVCAAAEAALLAALENRDRLLHNVDVLVEQRQRLEKTVESLRGVSYYPSDGNFLLLKFARDGRAVYEDLARRGVFVRRFSHPRLARHLRVSVGTPDETGRLIEALREAV